MAEFQEEVTRSIFPAGYRLGRPHEGTGDRHLKFALYDEEMRPLGDRIYTLTISGEVRDERLDDGRDESGVGGQHGALQGVQGMTLICLTMSSVKAFCQGASALSSSSLTM